MSNSTLVVFYVTHELVVQRRENHGIYEDKKKKLINLGYFYFIFIGILLIGCNFPGKEGFFKEDIVFIIETFTAILTAILLKWHLTIVSKY